MIETCRHTLNLACKSTPELRLAAHFLEPDEKFRAFHATYSALRLNEPDCDKFLNASDLNEFERNDALASLNILADQFRRRQIDDSLPHSMDLKLAMERFEISRQPFIKMAEILISDLNGDRFDTFDELLEYIDGAVAAPLSIFCHIAASSFDDRGQVHLPLFDMDELVRPLGYFMALSKIIEDCLKDASSEKGSIIYFDTHSLCEANLGREDFAKFAEEMPNDPRFRDLILGYFKSLAAYSSRSHEIFDKISHALPADGAFALRLVYELHARRIRQLDENGFVIKSHPDEPDGVELEKTAVETARKTGYPLDNLENRLESALAAELV